MKGKNSKNHLFDVLSQNKTRFIDFDKEEEERGDDQKKYENWIEFHTEEDNINVGAWILLNHPNFFAGSCKAS